VTAPKAATLSQEQKILQALNRLAFGPRPGDVEAVQKMGLQNWIDAQLNPSSIDDSALDRKIADFKLLEMSAEDLLLAYQADSGNIIRRSKDAQNSPASLPTKQLERLLETQKLLDSRGIRPGTTYEALGELINAKLLRSI